VRRECEHWGRKGERVHVAWGGGDKLSNGHDMVKIKPKSRIP